MVVRLGVLSLLALVLAPVLAAQTDSVDPIRELLVEVRGLRAAMERSATIGPRVQLFVARIQLQEQRIAELSRRATAVRSELRSVETDSLAASTQLKRFEELFPTLSLGDDRRGSIEHEIALLKTRLTLAERRQQQLTMDESELAQEIALEQGRWTAINEQLEQLERSLAHPEQKR